ncbi:hypothetical protein ONS95_006922 [Cadophora gregata]|uniref:uncharacterized protein n=1 Tax=Cadophora gregata TaxID=51156 RepID=UPI0026DC91C1|nr:uncharacterized protein ONS95_006922 [Cadophora gregata]KAK0101769.1 hypothetical protein ONS95_006922 [Cadophora gregata]KAK0106215.1 hypothetical protein ONS96_003858 [Cadophora gregata f. sp. sojae]
MPISTPARKSKRITSESPTPLRPPHNAKSIDHYRSVQDISRRFPRYPPTFHWTRTKEVPPVPTSIRNLFLDKEAGPPEAGWRRWQISPDQSMSPLPMLIDKQSNRVAYEQQVCPPKPTDLVIQNATTVMWCNEHLSSDMPKDGSLCFKSSKTSTFNNVMLLSFYKNLDSLKTCYQFLGRELEIKF